MKSPLNAYFVKAHKDEDCGLAVVATTAKQAIKFMWKAGDYWESEYIDLRAHLLKNADITELPAGYIVYDPVEGLRRHCYVWAEGQCPICGKDDAMLYDGGDKIGCLDCLEDKV